MSHLKKIVLALGTASLHFFLLKFALFLQGFYWFFWPSLLLRLVGLLFASPVMAFIGLMSINFGVSPPFELSLFLFHLICCFFISKLRVLVKTLSGPTLKSRRTLFAGTAVVTLSTLGMAGEARDLRVRRERLDLDGLDPQLEGLRLVLLADLHRGPAVGQEYLREVIQEVNQAEPDVVLMPGDFVSKSASYFKDLQVLLGDLRPKIASFATLGNHDHWEGGKKCAQCLRKAGVLLLNNDHLVIGPDRRLSRGGREGLVIAGVDDCGLVNRIWNWPCRQPPRMCPQYSFLTTRLSETQGSASHNVSVQFSGHTHGGQVVFPGLGPVATASQFGTKYLSGWAEGPHWPVFTTTGVGTSTVPVRLCTKPEIVVFTLKSKQKRTPPLEARSFTV